MKTFATTLLLTLILVLSNTRSVCQAFSCGVVCRVRGGSFPTLISFPTGWSSTIFFVSRDVSLGFLNRDATTKTTPSKIEEEDSIPSQPVMVDRFPPDVEHSHPSIDQDIQWMEQEAIQEFLSVMVVLAILTLMESILQKIQA